MDGHSGVGLPAGRLVKDGREVPFRVSGLIDTHCHLDLIAGSVKAVLDGAHQAGVAELITVGISVPSSVQAVVLARAHSEVYATVGLHPHDARLWSDRVADELERLAGDRRVVAIGECGLDYYRDLSPRDEQQRAFIGQIELARRVGKALVVHVREAADEALALLGEHAGGLTVVLHCFSQPRDLDECVSRGYYISFAGNVTYRNAGDLRAAARRVPDDRLLLETDAPFLAPVPFRGKGNLPERVVHTAALVAEVRGEDGRQLAVSTTDNARRAFGLPA
jgi:TatD DNase family protein